MFDIQNEFYHEIGIPNCGGGIYKTYKKSFFVRWTIDSEILESSPENTHYYDVKSKRFVEKSKTYYGYEYTGVNPDTNRYKEFVILQMIIISKDYLMCEIILKEDFDENIGEAEE